MNQTEKMFQRQTTDPTSRELRQFGFILGLMLVLVFVLLVPWLTGTALPKWPWVPACFLWFAVIFFPDALRHVYRAWMWLVMVINAVMTRVVLGIVFYLVVFPIGMTMRLMGRDLLARQWNAALQSYRVPSASSKANDMERPF